MFKSSSKQGVQEAADFILALKKSGAIDSKDLVLSISIIRIQIS